MTCLVKRLVPQRKLRITTSQSKALEFLNRTLPGKWAASGPRVRRLPSQISALDLEPPAVEGLRVLHSSRRHEGGLTNVHLMGRRCTSLVAVSGLATRCCGNVTLMRSSAAVDADLPLFADPVTSRTARHPAKPFLKWVGGKRQLLGALLDRIPDGFQTYHEPFLGGGALFFALRPTSACLSDTNHRLIGAYRGVRDDVSSVITSLVNRPVSREFFETERRRQVDGLPDADVAAWLIYLNRTGYNGLYRVNRKGQFNVPFGRYTNPTTCDPETLLACSTALQKAQLSNEDFETVLTRAVAGDFVYFDPPYIPISRNSSFTRYTAGQFDLHDHRRLRDVALELKRRGVNVLISNSAAPAVFRLYESDFQIETVSAARYVNSDPLGRGKIFETLIR
jgi:DNA adenine methylase